MVADNQGNLPIHLAVKCLKGEVGRRVVYVTMGKAENQGHDLRLLSTTKQGKQTNDETVLTRACAPSAANTLTSIIHAKNAFSHATLARAVRSNAKW